MEDVPKVKVRLVFTNPKCLRALAFICETMGEAVEDMPWRSDLKHTIKACRYLMRHVSVWPESQDGDADS